MPFGRERVSPVSPSAKIASTKDCSLSGVSQRFGVVGQVQSVLLSGATGTSQDHLTVPNYRPVPPATSRPQVTGHVPIPAILTRPPPLHRGPVQVGSDY